MCKNLSQVVILLIAFSLGINLLRAEDKASGKEAVQCLEPDGSGVLYFNDFSTGDTRGWRTKEEVRSKEWKTRNPSICELDGRKVLYVPGKHKWIGASYMFTKPLSLKEPVWLKLVLKPEGAAECVGVSVFRRSGPQQTNMKARSGRAYESLNEWYTLYFKLNDFAGKDDVLRGIKIAQRCIQGTELPNNGSAPHSFCIDSIRIATGKAGKEIEEEAGEHIKLPLYKGERSYRVGQINGVTLWHAPAEVKVFRDQPVPEEEDKEIKLSLARNEYESFQVVAVPDSGAEPASLSLEFKDLKSSEGNILPAGNITWYPEVYLRLKGRNGVAGFEEWWPDVLSHNRKLSLKGRGNHPVWVSVKVDKNQKAGIYEGIFKVVLEKNGKVDVREIPLQVKVWNFELPRSPSFVTNQQLWNIGNRKHPYCYSRRREFLKILADHKMYDAQAGMGDLDYCVNELGQNVFKILKGGGHSNARRIKGHKIFTEGYREALHASLRRSLDRLAKAGVTPENSLVYVYLWNETWGDVNAYPQIAYIAEQTAEVNPNIKRMGAAAWHPSLEGKADILAHGYNKRFFNGESKRPDKLEFWLSGVFPFFLEARGIDTRLGYGLRNVQENISGAFSWGVNAWPKNKEGQFDPDRVWEWVSRSNYSATLYFPGGTKYSSDPRLCFSLRMELGRDGIEDYEYVRLLKKKLKTEKDSKKKNEIEALLKEINQTDFEMPLAMGKARQNMDAVDKLYSLREKMGELLSEK